MTAHIFFSFAMPPHISKFHKNEVKKSEDTRYDANLANWQSYARKMIGWIKLVDLMTKWTSKPGGEDRMNSDHLNLTDKCLLGVLHLHRPLPFPS